MIKIWPTVEFYITNVCNLTCRGCNRFNNYNFKGHQYWDDYAEDYEAWSMRLDIPNIGILGGEPTLNPDLEKWCANLRRLWPDSVITVHSNGTYQKEQHKKFWNKYRIGWGIAIHDPEQIDEIKKFWGESAYETLVFHNTTVNLVNGEYLLHSSDPQLAFNCCDMKYDHTMYKGKLWKCPMMAVLPDFDSQFSLTLDDRQRELLYSYRPLASNCSDEEIQNFVDSRDSPISQCEFCPQEITWHTALGQEQYNLPPPIVQPMPDETDEVFQEDLRKVKEIKWLTKHNK